MTWRLAGVALALGVATTGCFGRSIQPAEAPDRACVYGNILVDGQYVPDAVIMHEVGKVYAAPFVSPPAAITYTNGDFFFDNVPPGKYYVARFKIGRDLFVFSATNQQQLDMMTFDVAPGSARFLGAFSVTTGSEVAKMLGAGSFNIQRAPQPDQKTVAQHLMPHLQGTGWDALVQAGK